MWTGDGVDRFGGSYQLVTVDAVVKSHQISRLLVDPVQYVFETSFRFARWTIFPDQAAFDNTKAVTE
jgi:hypothetical protein